MAKKERTDSFFPIINGSSWIMPAFVPNNHWSSGMVLIPIQKGKNNFVLKQTHTQMNAEKWKQITSFVNNEQVNQENHSVKRYFWKTTEFSVYWDDYSCLPCQPQVSKWCPICHYLDCRQSSSKVAAKKGMKIGWVKMFAKIQKSMIENLLGAPPLMRMDMK